MGGLSWAEQRDRVKSQVVWEQESQDREQSTWVRAAFLRAKASTERKQVFFEESGSFSYIKT